MSQATMSQATMSQAMMSQAMQKARKHAGVAICRDQQTARGRSEAAFTLVELMIVVAIISVLATTAAPKLLEYTHKARDVEAMEALSKIADGASAYYQAVGHLPVAADDEPANLGPLKVSYGYGPSPVDICGHGGRATNEDLAVHFRTLASKYIWDKVNFMPGFGARFTYTFSGVSNYVPGAQTVTAWLQAERSLDCSGAAGTWVSYRSRLYYQDGTLRRTTPYQVRY